jgi:hypothetical protein
VKELNGLVVIPLPTFLVLIHTVCCSTSSARRPSPRIEDGEGVVAPRSATDSTDVSVMCLVLAASCICICPFYVVICYMSLICHMSVTRLV